MAVKPGKLRSTDGTSRSRVTRARFRLRFLSFFRQDDGCERRRTGLRHDWNREHDEAIFFISRVGNSYRRKSVKIPGEPVWVRTCSRERNDIEKAYAIA